MFASEFRVSIGVDVDAARLVAGNVVGVDGKIAGNGDLTGVIAEGGADPTTLALLAEAADATDARGDGIENIRRASFGGITPGKRASPSRIPG